MPLRISSLETICKYLLDYMGIENKIWGKSFTQLSRGVVWAEKLWETMETETAFIFTGTAFLQVFCPVNAHNTI